MCVAFLLPRGDRLFITWITSPFAKVGRPRMPKTQEFGAFATAYCFGALKILVLHRGYRKLEKISLLIELEVLS